MFALIATSSKTADRASQRNTLGNERHSWQSLLDPTLSNFDIYLGYRGDQIMKVLRGEAAPELVPVGLNPSHQDVFTILDDDRQSVLRVSGEYYGCIATKSEFSNFHLRAQVKFGDKKWEPRLTESRDSGILYFSRGQFGVDYFKAWALSQEFQVIEHGLGEYWTVADAVIDIRVGDKEASPDGSPDAPKWDASQPWQTFMAPNNHALAGSDEYLPGRWNMLELLCFEGNCVHMVNGRVVMALANSRFRSGKELIPMTKGRLQIQSEAAEVFYKGIQIRSLDEMPREYRSYFRNK